MTLLILIIVAILLLVIAPELVLFLFKTAFYSALMLFAGGSLVLFVFAIVGI